MIPRGILKAPKTVPVSGNAEGMGAGSDWRVHFTDSILARPQSAPRPGAPVMAVHSIRVCRWCVEYYCWCRRPGVERFFGWAQPVSSIYGGDNQRVLLNGTLFQGNWFRHYRIQFCRVWLHHCGYDPAHCAWHLSGPVFSWPN